MLAPGETYDVEVSPRAGSALSLRYSLPFFGPKNANPVLAQVNTFGSALGTPTSVQVARLVRLGVKVGF